MRLLVLQAIAISALYQAAWAYNMWDLSPDQRQALEQILAEAAGVGDLYYPEAYYNPETRNEDPDTNKPVIPPDTYVAGGAGEGEQHLGPNLIPNTLRIVPEINNPVYDNPPNPCAAQDLKTYKTEVASKTKEEMGIMCLCEENWESYEKEPTDCVDAKKCCIPNMPNEADFVKRFQEAGKSLDGNDIFQNIGYGYKRNQYFEGEKRAGHVAKKAPILKRSSFHGELPGFRPPQSKYILSQDRRSRNQYFAGPIKKTVVAKKAPNLANGRLPIM